MTTLRAITDDLLALEALLSDVGGDVTDEVANEAIDQWLAEIGDALDQKLDAYADLINDFEHAGKIRRIESARLATLAAADENAVKRLKERLNVFLKSTGRKRVDTAYHRITVAGNGGKTPVEILPGYDPGLYAGMSTIATPEFVRIKVEWDMDAIRTALEGGRKLHFAKLGERGTHVRVS